MEQPKYNWKGASALKRKPEIEAEGTWFEFADDRWIKIAAATDLNPRWNAVSETFFKEWRRLLNAKAPPARRRALQAHYFARHLCRDWSGFLSADDVEVPFSAEACEAMLLDLDDIFAAVAEIVFEDKNFREERVRVVVDQGKG